MTEAEFRDLVNQALQMTNLDYHEYRAGNYSMTVYMESVARAINAITAAAVGGVEAADGEPA